MAVAAAWCHPTLWDPSLSLGMTAIFRVIDCCTGLASLLMTRHSEMWMASRCSLVPPTPLGSLAHARDDRLPGHDRFTGWRRSPARDDRHFPGHRLLHRRLVARDDMTRILRVPQKKRPPLREAFATGSAQELRDLHQCEERLRSSAASVSSHVEPEIIAGLRGFDDTLEIVHVRDRSSVHLGDQISFLQVRIAGR